MKLKEYKKEVLRTLPNLGSKQLDILHMILGMNSEFNEVVESKDLINCSEELTDILWYCVNYCNIQNIDIDQIFKFKKHSFYYGIEGLSHSVKSIFNKKYYTDKYLISLQVAISKLTDIEKKIFAYKKEIDKQVIINSIREVFLRINDCYSYFELDSEIYMERNINKLKLRYPEKFTEFDANNRDTDKEREVLEGKFTEFNQGNSRIINFEDTDELISKVKEMTSDINAKKYGIYYSY